jgi:hypothetical protein
MMSQLSISNEFVGKPWKVVKKDITWRDTTNYAAALKDTQDCYFDDKKDKKLKTHPMFPVTLGWPLIIDIEDYIDIPKGKEIIGQLVHFSTYIGFHKMIETPARLVINSQIAQLRPHRKGTEVAFQFTVTDEENQIYHIEYMTCILRDVFCRGGEKTLPDYPQIIKEIPQEVLWKSDLIAVEPELPYIYDGCTGIYNPIHTSPAFAESVGLPGVILQGTATIALGIREVIKKEINGSFDTLHLISAKLNSMVLQNHLLEVQLVKRIVKEDYSEFYFQIYNHTVEVMAVTYGYIRLS